MNKGWNCKACNGYNDILDIFCIYCKNYILIRRPYYLDDTAIHAKYLRNPNRLQDFISMPKEDMLELHHKFYNAQKVLIKDMDIPTLRKHRDELRLVVHEGRARLNAYDDELREKESKSGNKEWLVSSEAGPNVTDSLAVVKERKQRMTKADKLKEAMKSLGIDNTDELMANVERSATNSNLNKINLVSDKVKEVIQSEFCRIERHSECVGKFKNDKGSFVCNCECHKITAETTVTDNDGSDPFGFLG